MDFMVSDHGSIWLFQPLTESASAWFEHNLDPDCMMLGSAYAVEPRYADDIIEGALAYGLNANVGAA